MTLEVIILAAGQGTRMKSSKPKVLHRLAGRALLQHVLDTALALSPEKIHVVIGHQGAAVQSEFSHLDSINWVHQAQQHGTGHAVQQVMPDLAKDSTVLILYGDVPLIEQQTLKALLSKISTCTLALLTVKSANPSGLGRIIRDQQRQIMAIVEHKDASEEQRLIDETNTGILAVRAEPLSRWLAQLDDDNAQGELYLTDIIAMAVAEAGASVATLTASSEHHVGGVNSQDQLAQLERHYQYECASQLMQQGVHIIDPHRIDIRSRLADIVIGQDTQIDINVILQGKVNIGHHCKIGAHSIIIDSDLGDQVEVAPYSHIEQAIISKRASIGPYARLRPGSRLGKEAKVGNFVEMKNSTLGHHSKANHLSYLGDAIIGEHVNIGAGTITCNYDGVNKSQTLIHNHAFIGSNSALVAPVTVGKEATVGAGSTITKDIPDHHLGIARGKQKNIEGWSRPKKK